MTAQSDVQTVDAGLIEIVKQADWYADMDANAGLAHHLAKHWPAIRASLPLSSADRADPIGGHETTTFDAEVQSAISSTHHSSQGE
jgi:hypothetical protein